MTDSMTPMPGTRPRQGTRWWPTVVVAVIAVAVYVGVLALYGSSTRLDVAVDQRGSADDKAMVAVEFTSIDPLRGTAQALVRVLPATRAVDENLRLREDLLVQVISSFPDQRDDQARMGYAVTKLDFPAGSSVLTLAGTATLTVEGRYQDYPFDVFRTTLTATVEGGSGDAEPTRLEVLGDVPSWLIVGDEVPVSPVVESSAVEVELLRAGSTKTFVILLLVAMVVLGVLAMLVAVAVSNGRRKVEATMASWFAAMLFALIPLRLNLPGAPPIGVWMDFVVVLWVLLAIMAGLALFITAWLRRTPPPDAPPPQRPGTGPSVDNSGTPGTSLDP